MSERPESALLAADPAPVKPGTDLRELVRAACRRFPDRIAFANDRRRWTFAELGRRVRGLSALFDSLGVTARDTVGVVLSPRPEILYETRLATFEHGAMLFGITPSMPPIDLARMIRSVDPKVVLYDAELMPGFPETLVEILPDARAVAVCGPAGDYEGLLAGVEDRESSHEISPDDLAALGFTSGTTGKPKGITATHWALAESCRMFIDVLRRAGGEKPGGFFNGMPLFAAGGGMIVPCLHAGMTMYVPDGFDAANALTLMASERVGAAFLTPSMLIDLLDEDLESFDLSALGLVIYGSAGTPAAKTEEAVRRLGPILLHGDGMSECLPPAAVLWPEEHGTRECPADRFVLRSAGRPFEGVQVRIESEIGAALSPGQTGEIVIQSPTVTRGYWNDEERTAESLRDGWWHSGDLGFVDDAGRVHVLDRKHDVLRRGERVILPRAIEEAASEHPAVKEVCVVQPEGSERIVAAISLRRRMRGLPVMERVAEVLMNFLGDRIRPADLPDEIRLFEELPRSFQGKVLRREVRDALATPSR